MIGDLRSVVSDTDFVVKQLAPDVADELHELAGLTEQGASAVEFLDPPRERSKQLLEVPRPAVVARLLCPGKQSSGEASGSSI